MFALRERTPRSVTDLSRRLALDPGTLPPLLKRLEAAGLHAVLTQVIGATTAGHVTGPCDGVSE